MPTLFVVISIFVGRYVRFQPVPWVCARICSAHRTEVLFVIAALSSGRIWWASRDDAAAQFGYNWVLGEGALVVAFSGSSLALVPFDRDRLLPKNGVRFIGPKKRLDGLTRIPGERFVPLIRPDLETAGLWRPSQLVSLSYADRYVRSPLIGLLVSRDVARLAVALSSPQRSCFRLITSLLKAQDGAPYRLVHDWRFEEHREQVLRQLCLSTGLDLDLKVGPCRH